mmetsp:Transcript_1744/g.7790  ORF Transcript_1744/g.7790 Transcript_1744/m.7790 type:complete len:235 (+) Transcript_1744:977-1681(+)
MEVVTRWTGTRSRADPPCTGPNRHGRRSNGSESGLSCERFWKPWSTRTREVYATATCTRATYCWTRKARAGSPSRAGRAVAGSATHPRPCRRFERARCRTTWRRRDCCTMRRRRRTISPEGPTTTLRPTTTATTTGIYTDPRLTYGAPVASSRSSTWATRSSTSFRTRTVRGRWTSSCPSSGCSVPRAAPTGTTSRAGRVGAGTRTRIGRPGRFSTSFRRMPSGRSPPTCSGGS